MKSWHFSSISIVGIMIAIFVAGSLNQSGLGAILMLVMFPVLVWFGWTLHERSLHRNQILEQRVMDKIRASDVSLRRRKAADDV